ACKRRATDGPGAAERPVARWRLRPGQAPVRSGYRSGCQRDWSDYSPRKEPRAESRTHCRNSPEARSHAGIADTSCDGLQPGSHGGSGLDAARMTLPHGAQILSEGADKVNPHLSNAQSNWIALEPKAFPFEQSRIDKLSPCRITSFCRVSE